MNTTVTVVSPPERLRSSRDFRRVLTAGARASAGPVQVVIAAGAPGQTRVGVSVGRTVGRAVTRNRVKRLLREAARNAALPEGCDVVLLAKPGLVGRTFQEVEHMVGEAIRGARARA